MKTTFRDLGPQSSTGTKPSTNGKGDNPRPIAVTRDEFSSNWDRTFGTPTRE
jgi:hypothetical protein